jgi:hypothetical protein
MTSGDEWALEILIDRLKRELIELLREHSSEEVKEIMEIRRAIAKDEEREPHR